MNPAIRFIQAFTAGKIDGKELSARCAALRGLPEAPESVPMPHQVSDVPEWQREAERELVRLLRRHPKSKVAAALAEKKRTGGLYSTWRKCDHALRILEDVEDQREP